MKNIIAYRFFRIYLRCIFMKTMVIRIAMNRFIIRKISTSIRAVYS